MEIILIAVACLFGLAFFNGGMWSSMQNSEFAPLVPYWKAVSFMETDEYRSPVYHMANNCFGMKQPLVRKTVSLGPYGAIWASYASPAESVADMVLYMRAQNYPTDFISLKAMISFMGSKGYFGAETVDSYYNKVVAKANKGGLDISDHLSV